MSDNDKGRESRSASRSVSPRAPGKSASRSPARSKDGSHHSRSKSWSRSKSRSGSHSNHGSHKHYSHSRSRSRSGRRRSRSRSYSGERRHRSLSHSPMSNRRRHIGNRANPDPNACLGVFGLSLYTTERDLRDVFSKYGPLADVCIVYDQQSRRSRGFAFVYFENTADAKEAKDRANGMELDGRRIRVDFSITKRPHTPTPGIYMGLAVVVAAVLVVPGAIHATTTADMTVDMIEAAMIAMTTGTTTDHTGEDLHHHTTEAHTDLGQDPGLILLIMNKLYVGNLSPSVTVEDLEQLFGERELPAPEQVLLKSGYAFVDFPDQNSAIKAIETLSAAGMYMGWSLTDCLGSGAQRGASAEYLSDPCSPGVRLCFYEVSWRWVTGVRRKRAHKQVAECWRRRWREGGGGGGRGKVELHGKLIEVDYSVPKKLRVEGNVQFPRFTARSAKRKHGVKACATPLS
ncbi:hypothetical protein CCH79_00002857 [Gambusia affinis]|uniref:Transformer-2 protein homolog beta n=1 Tax=Gambusia affinis TaxID=33528 RepID=A0A315WMT7_GAMAF|nr:hypothetical protein CCH79_00002857 [Gambusia affinis]